ncbi:hypothetical protein LSH36_246g01002 [Paralvinella palmiformis]|uniref:Uncharacterized protein n=1 Tax=Paralvinella palmiformis TaxID=53620 RepID=A0AAD9JLA4_9ANNE|nr:hypothetical protein LSH36_246g01002 [Paralvinella palmiformis]
MWNAQDTNVGHPGQIQMFDPTQFITGQQPFAASDSLNACREQTENTDQLAGQPNIQEQTPWNQSWPQQGWNGQDSGQWAQHMNSTGPGGVTHSGQKDVNDVNQAWSQQGDNLSAVNQAPNWQQGDLFTDGAKPGYNNPEFGYGQDLHQGMAQVNAEQLRQGHNLGASSSESQVQSANASNGGMSAFFQHDASEDVTTESASISDRSLQDIPLDEPSSQSVLSSSSPPTAEMQPQIFSSSSFSKLPSEPSPFDGIVSHGSELHDQLLNVPDPQVKLKPDAIDKVKFILGGSASSSANQSASQSPFPFDQSGAAEPSVGTTSGSGQVAQNGPSHAGALQHNIPADRPSSEVSSVSRQSSLMDSQDLSSEVARAQLNGASSIDSLPLSTGRHRSPSVQSGQSLDSSGSLSRSGGQLPITSPNPCRMGPGPNRHHMSPAVNPLSQPSTFVPGSGPVSCEAPATEHHQQMPHGNIYQPLTTPEDAQPAEIMGGSAESADGLWSGDVSQSAQHQLNIYATPIDVRSESAFHRVSSPGSAVGIQDPVQDLHSGSHDDKYSNMMSGEVTVTKEMSGGEMAHADQQQQLQQSAAPSDHFEHQGMSQLWFSTVQQDVQQQPVQQHVQQQFIQQHHVQQQVVQHIDVQQQSVQHQDVQHIDVQQQSVQHQDVQQQTVLEQQSIQQQPIQHQLVQQNSEQYPSVQQQPVQQEPVQQSYIEQQSVQQEPLQQQPMQQQPMLQQPLQQQPVQYQYGEANMVQEGPGNQVANQSLNQQLQQQPLHEQSIQQQQNRSEQPVQMWPSYHPPGQQLQHSAQQQPNASQIVPEQQGIQQKSSEALQRHMTPHSVQQQMPQEAEPQHSLHLSGQQPTSPNRPTQPTDVQMLRQHSGSDQVKLQHDGTQTGQTGQKQQMQQQQQVQRTERTAAHHDQKSELSFCGTSRPPVQQLATQQTSEHQQHFPQLEVQQSDVSQLDSHKSEVQQLSNQQLAGQEPARQQQDVQQPNQSQLSINPRKEVFEKSQQGMSQQLLDRSNQEQQHGQLQKDNSQQQRSMVQQQQITGQIVSHQQGIPQQQGIPHHQDIPQQQDIPHQQGISQQQGVAQQEGIAQYVQQKQTRQINSQQQRSMVQQQQTIGQIVSQQQGMQQGIPHHQDIPQQQGMPQQDIPQQQAVAQQQGVAQQQDIVQYVQQKKSQTRN